MKKFTQSRADRDAELAAHDQLSREAVELRAEVERLKEEVVQSASAVIAAVGGEVRVPFRLLTAAHEGRFTMTRHDDLYRLESVFRAALAAEPAEATPPAEQRCACGGRIVPESNRGVEHRICVECNGCAQCDAEQRAEGGA